ncbi:hypothetical protein TSAR_001810, partial [Trichomalopsis sarcophagae]
IFSSTNLWISSFLTKDTGSLPFCDPYKNFCTIKRYFHEFVGGQSPDQSLTSTNIKV